MDPALSSDPGGVTVRRLIPYALLLPVLFGWLRLHGIGLFMSGMIMRTTWGQAVRNTDSGAEFRIEV